MLVTMKEILDKASAENYAVAAPTISNSVDVDASIAAAEELNAPIILNARFENLGPAFSRKACPRDLCAWLRIRCEHAKVPIAINEDHGSTLQAAILNIQAGCTSLGIDRSDLPFEENVIETAKIAEIARFANCSCEGELGSVGNPSSPESYYTNVDEAVDFVKRTGVDCLAVSIGTTHGTYPRELGTKLGYDRLVAIKVALNEAMGYSYPLVLHGAIGIPDDDMKKLCSLGINKVNINTDLLSAAKAASLAPGKGSIWGMASTGFKEKLKEMITLFGSNGKA